MLLFPKTTVVIMRYVSGGARRPVSLLRNTRYFGGEAKESYAVRGALEQLSDTLTSQVQEHLITRFLTE